MAAGKRSVKNPATVGHAMAARVLRARRKALSRRKNALAAQPSPKGLAKGPTSAGTLIAEGDSWFDYPLCDVLKELEDGHGFDIESVAHKGDTVEDMAYGEGQLDGFARLVEKVLRRGVVPRAILLSGGGNDIAGDEFAILLNHAASSIAGLNDSIVTGVIDERLQDAYVTILAAITNVCESLVARPLPIIVHGYDYPVPDGRGFLGGWGPLPGPWLEPGFRRKGFAAMAARKPVMVELIDRFNAMLRRIAGKQPFKHVRYLDLRNTLSTGANYRDWWGNELHPTRIGFETVAAKFAAVI